MIHSGYLLYFVEARIAFLITKLHPQKGEYGWNRHKLPCITSAGICIFFVQNSLYLKMKTRATTSVIMAMMMRYTVLEVVIRATPHKCNDTHCRIAILWKAIGLPRTFARKSALTQAARQGLSARIRFANANMMLNLAPCFSSPRYRGFRKRSCFLTTPNTCSTFARTEDFACSAFFAAY